MQLAALPASCILRRLPSDHTPQVGDADNTFQLASSHSGDSGAYYIGNRRARPVAAAADEALQERLWALWEQQTGANFKISV